MKSSDMEPARPRHALAAVAAITLWGVSFAVVKIALTEVSPFTLIAFRYGVAGVVLSFVAALTGAWRTVGPRDLAAIAGLAAVGVFAQQTLQVVGQRYAAASVAAILASTAPALTVLLAVAFLKETLSPRQIAGVVLACIGAAVASSSDVIESSEADEQVVLGNLLVLGSAVVWAVFTIQTRRVTLARSPLAVTAGMCLFGCLYSLPLAIGEGRLGDLLHVSPRGAFALTYMALGATVLAYLLNAYALKRLPASRVAAIQTLEPISAVLAAAALLSDERITALLLIGGALTIIGVFLSERATGKRSGRA
jgi:drug/metabolite transporter (DMT)-like permease